MKSIAVIVSVYGLLIALGGVMGYVKGGSLISLASGGGSGLALLALSHFLFRGKVFAQYLTIALIFLLDGFFTYRFVKTLHFFPSGLLSLLSLIVLILIVLRLRLSKSKEV